MAPAATLETLATALKEIYSKVDPKYGDTEVRVIGTRHGEKLYETLVTREEMAKAIDMGNYYRIPCDNRDLNYDKFFSEGDEVVSRIEDYHSHNTQRLDVEGMKKQLMRLRFIQEDLGLIEKAKARETVPNSRCVKTGNLLRCHQLRKCIFFGGEQLFKVFPLLRNHQ